MKSKEIQLLIVDDSPLILTRLVEMLQELDYVKEIFTASNYADAIIIVREKCPGIALLDIHLGGKNGIELLQIIRKECRDIKVVMLSNTATTHYRKLCKDSGADHFVDKSAEFDLIPEILRSFAQTTV